MKKMLEIRSWKTTFSKNLSYQIKVINVTKHLIESCGKKSFKQLKKHIDQSNTCIVNMTQTK